MRLLRPLAVASATALAATALVASGSSGTASAATSAASGSDPVLDWFSLTRSLVNPATSEFNTYIGNVGFPGAPVQAPITAAWATSWRAADAAVAGQPAADAPAALAQALHDTLSSFVPTAAAIPQLDTQLARTLATVPDGPAKTTAIAAGAKAAADVLSARANDGLSLAEVETKYVPKTAPGLWRPTATYTPAGASAPVDSPAVLASLGHAEPYALKSAAQFAIPAPPALGTATYRADLAEVRAKGAAKSTTATTLTRTEAETVVANVWQQSAVNGWTQVLEAALEQLAAQGASTARETHVVSVFHQVTTDSTIAGYYWKYKFQHWRPVTAIHEADLAGAALSDGDPATAPDLEWASYLNSPVHPEYPSGHTVYAASGAAVLAALVGPIRTPIHIVNNGAAPFNVGARDYTSWDQLVQDNVDARVWEGVHFRTSDVVGAELGKLVAAYDLSVLDPKPFVPSKPVVTPTKAPGKRHHHKHHTKHSRHAKARPAA